MCYSERSYNIYVYIMFFLITSMLESHYYRLRTTHDEFIATELDSRDSNKIEKYIMNKKSLVMQHSTVKIKAVMITEGNKTVVSLSDMKKSLKKNEIVFLFSMLNSSLEDSMFLAFQGGYPFLIYYIRSPKDLLYSKSHNSVAYKNSIPIILLARCLYCPISALNSTEKILEFNLDWNTINLPVVIFSMLGTIWAMCNLIIVVIYTGDTCLQHIDDYISAIFLPAIRPFRGNRRKYESNNCMICLQDYERDDEVLVLTCNHEIHKQCFLNLYVQTKCPVCMGEVANLKLLPPEMIAPLYPDTSHFDLTNNTESVQESTISDEEHLSTLDI